MQFSELSDDLIVLSIDVNVGADFIDDLHQTVAHFDVLGGSDVFLFCDGIVLGVLTYHVDKVIKSVIHSVSVITFTQIGLYVQPIVELVFLSGMTAPLFFLSINAIHYLLSLKFSKFSNVDVVGVMLTAFPFLGHNVRANSLLCLDPQRID